MRRNRMGHGRGWYCAILSVAVVVAIADDAASQSPTAAPTPEELVKLVLAGKARYRSVDVEFSVRRYAIKDGTRADKPEGESSRIWRATDTRAFAKAIKTEYLPDGSTRTIVQSHAFAPTWAKRMDEEQNKTPLAVITRDQSMRDTELDASPLAALWPYGEELWAQILNANSTVTQSANGLLELTSQCFDDGGSLCLRIDPARGYVPVKSSIMSKAGEAIMFSEVTRFDQVGGLWLPMEYTLSLVGQYDSLYSVKAARVNVDIPDKDMDIVFPSGTRVVDRIVDIDYSVDENIRRLPPLSGPRSESGNISRLPALNDLLTTAPASNASLEKAANRVHTRPLNEDQRAQTPFRFVWSIVAGVAVGGTTALIAVRRRYRKNA